MGLRVLVRPPPLMFLVLSLLFSSVIPGLIGSPTALPFPERAPSAAPTASRPSARPTARPSASPSLCKTCPTSAPSPDPTPHPTTKPTAPTLKPTHTDDVNPYPPDFIFPTKHPTAAPNWPTHRPTPNPSARPTRRPTAVPTVKPSPMPSPQPSAHPTLMPTPPGTVPIEITFSGTQWLASCRLPSPVESSRFWQTLRDTVALCVDPFARHNVTAANVVSLSLAAAPSPIPVATVKQRGSAIFIYKVHIVSWGVYDFAYFSKLLTESIETGFFDQELQYFATRFNASGLTMATNTQFSISLVSDTGGSAPDKPKPSQALIFGIAFGVGGGLCVLFSIYYLSSKGPRPWEEGYEDWFYKNEDTLRKSGIGIPPGLRHRPNPHPHDDVVDDIPPEYCDPGYDDESQVVPAGGAKGGDLELVARRATVQIIPAQPQVSGEHNMGTSPWAVDNDRDSIVIVQNEMHRRL